MQAAYRPNATELAEILIVDDSLEFTHYITRILALDFPEVGVGAWDWRWDVPTEDHDWSRTKLIILDYRLGDRDGLTWLEALRSRPGIPPIVLVTSSHDDRVRDRALALGASHFFQKEQLTRPVVAKLVRSACEC